MLQLDSNFQNLIEKSREASKEVIDARHDIYLFVQKTLADCVTSGSKLLDTEFPNWFNHIDVEIISIQADSMNHILSLVFNPLGIPEANGFKQGL